MLKQRVITALLLLAVLLPALFARQPEWFMGVAWVLLCLGAWEWAQLNGVGKAAAWWFAALCAALCAAMWWANWPYRALPMLWIVWGAAWVMGGALLLRRGVALWPQVPRGLRLAGGLLALALAWLAVAQARVLGINFLLSVLVLVWVADIGAYAAGRTWGRRKLAPSISPGKSWEGVWGGMVCVLVLAVAWAWADARWQASVPSLYTRLVAQSWWLLILAGLFMAAMSVVGDLVESLVTLLGTTTATR
jgi:phosphatidate cytidylyltransferase